MNKTIITINQKEIYLLIKERDITIEKIAKEIDLSAKELENILQSNSISAVNLYIIAEILSCPIDNLIKTDNISEPISFNLPDIDKK